MIKQLSGVCLLVSLLIGCGADNSHTSSYSPSYGQPDPAPSEPSAPIEPPDSSEPPVTSEPPPATEPPVASEPPPTTEPTEPTTPPSDGGLVDGKALLQWARPDQRENGEYLEVDDIGGYELRYRTITEPDFQVVVIEDSWAQSYEIASLLGAYEFQVATFDRNGLYSEFVDITPY